MDIKSLVKYIRFLCSITYLKHNWASEASPTLGCSIEISRDIYLYIYMSVCLSWSKKA